MPEKKEAGELVFLPVSPWSLKARWALVASCVPMRLQRYAVGSFLQLLALRLRARRWNLSFPIAFLPDGQVLFDSLDIAKLADRTGNCPGTLFPTGREADVERWNAVGEMVLCYSRGLLTKALLTSKATRLRFTPAPVRALGPVGDWLTLLVLRGFQAKYAAKTAEANLENVQAALREVQAALRKAGGGRAPGAYLLGGSTPTYADIAVACSLVALGPVPAPYAKASPRQPERGAKELCDSHEFDDLLEWREQLLANHFPTDALVAQLRG